MLVGVTTQPISDEHEAIPTVQVYIHFQTLSNKFCKLLRMVLDNNKCVQEAGGSAFATL